MRGSRHFGCEAVIRYRLSRRLADQHAWLVDVIGYEFGLHTEQQVEFLAFHYHPIGASHITIPHIHVATTAPVDLSKAHIPSGEVTFQRVVRFAIEELGVEPLRQDWRTILN